MPWDITTPPDTESARLGASRIREFKSDVLAALTYEGIFPGADVANPKFSWKPQYGATAARPAAPAVGQTFVNTTLACWERYNGATWDAIATLIPVGTIMPFFQAAAPTGWTQVVTQSDAVMRVVAGAGGGNGGADSISAPPSHTHTVAAQATPVRADINQVNVIQTVTTPTGATVAFSPKYVDMIICSKN